uniref:G-protein coupled receptors family 1 profile domain-containing protein n=1 Tax=Ditylenchus dipsaci TaxID=166011 RepID=A0A915CL90_9BILA
MDPEYINNASTSSISAEHEEKCTYHQPAYLEERFWLVSVAGTGIALISVVENLFLFFMLVRKKNHRKSHCLYLLLLAFFDVFMGAAYIPLMSFSLLLDYLQSVFLLRSWYAYMIPLITLSHIAMTSSSFLILAASFERYCITCWTSQMKRVNKFRKYIAASAILLGFVTKFTMAGEFVIIFNEECVNTMNEYSLKLSEMSMNHYYNLFWRLGFRNVVTVLLPFFLLLVMNLKIVIVLKDNLHIQMVKVNEVQIKRKVRAATRTLLMIVFTYLLANILNVLLTFWEYINIDTLMTDFVAFYTFGVDTVSILTILAGALRLPIYVTCMPQLRKEFIGYLKQFINGSKYNHQTNSEKCTEQEIAYAPTYAPTILRVSEMLMRLPKFSSSSTNTANTSTTDTDSDTEEDDKSEYSSYPRKQTKEKLLKTYSHGFNHKKYTPKRIDQISPTFTGCREESSNSISRASNEEVFL